MAKGGIEAQEASFQHAKKCMDLTHRAKSLKNRSTYAAYWKLMRMAREFDDFFNGLTPTVQD